MALVAVIVSVGGGGSKPAAPVGLHTLDKTATSVTLAWSPGGKTEPTLYRVYRNGTEVDTTSGATRTTDTGLKPATAYQYQVAAYVNETWSDRSTTLTVTTAEATLADAALTGDYTVHLTLSSAYGYTSLNAGDSETVTWTFNTKSDGSVVLHGTTTDGGWRMPLTQNGHSYSGTTHANVSQCSYKPVNTAISVDLTVNKGSLVNGQWTATRWTSTVHQTAPATTVGLLSCPGAGFTGTATGRVVG